MKKLLISIFLTVISNPLLGQKFDLSHLNYQIAGDADKYGPKSLRRYDRILYFKKGSDVTDRQAMLGREYYSNDVLIERELFRNGQLHGVQRKWHRNGQLAQEEPYFDGIRHGHFKNWDEAGNLTANFEIDEGNGTAVYFDSSGKVLRVTNYVNNVAHGLSVVRYKSNAVLFQPQSSGITDGIDYYIPLKEEGVTAITYYSSGTKHGVDIQMNGKEIEAFDFFVNGQKVDAKKYEEEANIDVTMPVYFPKADGYLSHLSDIINLLKTSFSEIRTVKIPLVVEENGEYIDKSGRSYKIPEIWKLSTTKVNG